jgi:predicted TIM-barrel fold metal-dependent hydrolase
MALPWIISADDHVIEPPDLFETRLPAKFREEGPRVVKLPWELGPNFARGNIRPGGDGPPVDFWQVEGKHLVVPRLEIGAGMDPELVDHKPMDYEEMPASCYQVKERLRAMDEARIERSLCFPNIVRFAGQMFLWLDDKELALAGVRAYNDFMVDEWAGESGGRLIPLCVVPLWDAQLAADEIRRNAARGVRAVTFTELPAVLGLPSIHDKDGYWLPFVEACAETGTVICIHIGSSSSVPRTSDDAPGCVSMTTVNFNAQLSFADWMFSGLLARYPTLKLAFSESQIGWMPYALERMDRIYRMGNKIARIPPELTAPDTYMAGRIYGCFFETTGLANRDAAGIDQITFERPPAPDPPGRTPTSTSLGRRRHVEATRIRSRGNAIKILDLDPTRQTPFRRPDADLCCATVGHRRHRRTPARR